MDFNSFLISMRCTYLLHFKLHVPDVIKCGIFRSAYWQTVQILFGGVLVNCSLDTHTMEPWLTYISLWRPGWPWNLQKSICLCFFSVGSKDVCHQALSDFLKSIFPYYWNLSVILSIPWLTFCYYMCPLKTLLSPFVTFFSSLWLFSSHLALNKSRKLFLSWIMPLALYLKIIVN